MFVAFNGKDWQPTFAPRTPWINSLHKAEYLQLWKEWEKIFHTEMELFQGGEGVAQFIKGLPRKYGYLIQTTWKPDSDVGTLYVYWQFPYGEREGWGRTTPRHLQATLPGIWSGEKQRPCLA